MWRSCHQKLLILRAMQGCSQQGDAIGRSLKVKVRGKQLRVVVRDIRNSLKGSLAGTAEILQGLKVCKRVTGV